MITDCDGRGSGVLVIPVDDGSEPFDVSLRIGGDGYIKKDIAQTCSGVE